MARRTRKSVTTFDATDRKILFSLSENARLPMKDLARKVGLSAPSTAERVRRLEEAGVLLGYTIRVSPAALGLPIGIFIRIRPMPGELTRVAALLAARPQIIQCDRVTGDDCFIAKAYMQSVDELERLIDDLLPYATTNTALIQSSPVTSRMPALPF
jgi:Lrp/AsnC family transcriptional regulator, leucine-responsive regulatory protein